MRIVLILTLAMSTMACEPKEEKVARLRSAATLDRLRAEMLAERYDSLYRAVIDRNFRLPEAELDDSLAAFREQYRPLLDTLSTARDQADLSEREWNKFMSGR